MEDYKQKYEEALARARVVNPGTKDYNIVTTIFPELKKSEDELIREELIHFLETCQDSRFIGNRKQEEWINWLEKQGDTSPTKDELEALRIAAYEPTKNWNEKLQSLYEKLTCCEQGWQKSNNKIESKFKIGDWITFYGRPAFKILKIEAEDNGILDYLLYQNGHDSFFNKEYVDKNARLWTIEDAKDGDILVDESKIFMYKWHINNEIGFYASFSTKGENNLLFNGVSFGTLNTIKNIYPATKEQRDLLSQKIKEAGYTWNADSKKFNWINHEL